MIEKIANKQGNWQACKEMIKCVEKLKKEKGCVTVAEIGVDIGATAVEVINLLKKGDKYYYFDLPEKISELSKDFKGLGSEADIIGISNTMKWRDSYSWSLVKLFLNEENIRFDVVYLDGVHDFLHDAAATSVIKEMMNPGGIIIFDDIGWNFANSPTTNPNKNPIVKEMYTDEQISSCMVDYVVKCLMDPDNRFQKVENEDYSNRRAIYKRL